jgi:glycosyltransferase involved in cell wall biosynthesis
MKVLYLAPSDSIHTFRWIKEIESRGIQTLLLHTDASSRQFHYTHSCRIRLSSRLSFQLNLVLAVVQIRWLISVFHPNIVHVHYLSTLGWAAALAGASPLVITLWGSDILQQDLKQTKIRWLMRKAFQQAALVTADSPLLLEKARELGARQCELITFGVDHGIFWPESDKGQLRRSFGLPEDAFIILSPRIMSDFYRTELLIEAFSLAAQDDQQVHLLMLAFAAEKDYLQRIWQRYGENRRLRLVQPLSHAHMREMYAVSDLLVSLPRSDGTPASFFEAMACGLPILSVFHESYTGLFKSGQDIVYLEDIQLADLALSIQKLRQDPELRQNLSCQGLETAHRHDFKQEMSRVQLLYQNLWQKRK